jgi:hypothetical protein
MTQPETVLLQQIRQAASELGAVLWRNNCGVAEYPGGARVPYGLGTGSADLVGFVPAPMPNGRTYPVFMAVEVKSKRGRLTSEQALYLKGVALFGGLAIVARSIADATGPIEAAMGGEDVLGRVWGL